LNQQQKKINKESHKRGNERVSVLPGSFWTCSRSQEGVLTKERYYVHVNEGMKLGLYIVKNISEGKTVTVTLVF